MSQKTHPIGLRVGVHRKWSSSWYEGSEYYSKKQSFFSNGNITSHGGFYFSGLESFIENLIKRQFITSFSRTRRVFLVDFRFFKLYSGYTYGFFIYAKISPTSKLMQESVPFFNSDNLIEDKSKPQTYINSKILFPKVQGYTIYLEIENINLRHSSDFLDTDIGCLAFTKEVLISSYKEFNSSSFKEELDSTFFNFASQLVFSSYFNKKFNIINMIEFYLIFTFFIKSRSAINIFKGLNLRDYINYKNTLLIFRRSKISPNIIKNGYNFFNKIDIRLKTKGLSSKNHFFYSRKKKVDILNAVDVSSFNFDRTTAVLYSFKSKKPKQIRFFCGNSFIVKKSKKKFSRVKNVSLKAYQKKSLYFKLVTDNIKSHKFPTYINLKRVFSLITNSQFSFYNINALSVVHFASDIESIEKVRKSGVIFKTSKPPIKASRKRLRGLEKAIGARFRYVGIFIKDLLRVFFFSIYLKKPAFLAFFISYVFPKLPRNRKETNFLRFLRKLLKIFAARRPEMIGVRIQFQGRINRWRRTKSMIATKGVIQYINYDNRIEYGVAQAVTRKGAQSVRIWLCYKKEFCYSLMKGISHYISLTKLI